MGQGGSQPPPEERVRPIREALDGARYERRLQHLAVFGERPGGTRPSAPALDRLPDALLARILSWVPGRDLLTRCRPVCRRWRDLIDGPTVWRLQGERRPGLGATLAAARLCPPPRWSRICLLEPFGRNLLRNPCGQDQFSHWQVQHGGHGWQVEENRCPVEGAPAQTCFVSSFGWCVKSQLVDLLEEGLWEELLDTYQPEIYISDWCPTGSGSTAVECGMCNSTTKGRTLISGQDTTAHGSPTPQSW
ncbi:F-box only protein 17-like isoform X2 [Mauremys mutica]|uniref:F-box only protein 17-like isoform X2 n=1 Tax=Mauremys mutica TaxID=74926 RepID=UPI001D1688AB|nr:F-box only protein 17-like isoform X2 [Mauremys mutica]